MSLKTFGNFEMSDCWSQQDILSIIFCTKMYNNFQSSPNETAGTNLFYCALKIVNRGGASEASKATLTDCSAGEFDGTCIKPKGYALEACARQITVITLEATRMCRKFAELCCAI